MQDSNLRLLPCESNTIWVYNNLQDAGTAEVRGSHTRHQVVWVGLWVGMAATNRYAKMRLRDVQLGKLTTH